jgi:cytochrome c-type biogenesis protein CcmH/NrfF
VSLTRNILIIGLLAGVSGTQAATPEQIKEVASDLVCLCGTCNRESLSTCQCGFATSERDLIGEMLESQKSRQQIVDSYVDRFGAMGLANPPDGYDVVWVVPFLLLIVGGFGVRQVLVCWRRDPVAVSSQPSMAVADRKPSTYADRLKNDLTDFEA